MYVQRNMRCNPDPIGVLLLWLDQLVTSMFWLSHYLKLLEASFPSNFWGSSLWPTKTMSQCCEGFQTLRQPIGTPYLTNPQDRGLAKGHIAIFVNFRNTIQSHMPSCYSHIYWVNPGTLILQYFATNVKVY